MTRRRLLALLAGAPVAAKIAPAAINQCGVGIPLYKPFRFHFDKVLPCISVGMLEFQRDFNALNSAHGDVIVFGRPPRWKR